MAPSDIAKRLGGAFAVSGAFLSLAALDWWWQTYSTVLDNGYIPAGEALTCVLGESEACASARGLCHALNPYCVGDYAAGGLWLGLLLMVAGTLMGGWQRPEARTDAAAIPPGDSWFGETRLRISRTIRYAAEPGVGNDNAALPTRVARGPAVPLSPRKRKPR